MGVRSPARLLCQHWPGRARGGGRRPLSRMVQVPQRLHSGRGSLVPGVLADLTILGGDPFQTEARNLPDLPVRGAVLASLQATAESEPV